MQMEVFPAGDLLAIGASLLWSVYSVVLSRIDDGLKETVIERRMVFYSLVTLLPILLLSEDISNVCAVVSSADVVISTLYLGCVASALCLWLWNVSINRIGVVRTNNYLYLLPVVSLLVSAIFADDEVSAVTVVSTFLILIGIILADR